MNNSNNNKDLFSEVIETALQRVGTLTVSRLRTYRKKIVSYFSSGLHIDH